MRRLLPGLLIALAASCSAADLLTRSHGDSSDGGNQGGKDTSEFPLLVTPDPDFAVAAASDGADCLITSYHGNIGSNGNVAAQLVLPTGQPTQPVDLGQNTGDVPTAAFDGSEYLVLHVVGGSGGSANLMARFIDKSGAPVGTDVQVASAADGFLASEGVAYGAGTFVGLYAVDADSNGVPALFVRTISSTGQVGPAQEVSPSTGSHTIDFDGQNFLTTFAPPGTSELHGHFIAPSGALGQSFLIAQITGQRFNTGARVAFSGGAHLVVYSSHATGTEPVPTKVFAQAISPAGALVGSATPVPVDSGHAVTSLVPIANGFAVGFQAGPQGGRSTLAQLYATGGNAQSSVVTVLTPDAKVASRSASLCPVSAGKFLAVIEELANTQGAGVDVYGKFVAIP